MEVVVVVILPMEVLLAVPNNKPSVKQSYYGLNLPQTILVYMIKVNLDIINSSPTKYTTLYNFQQKDTFVSLTAHYR